MKLKKPKIVDKITRKKPESSGTRITNDTVAEHRERVLAEGKRFKYPVQYIKHRLVINAIVIILVVLALLIGVAAQQLYVAQNSSDIMYRITKLFKLPVADVDGEKALYQDYLVQYRLSKHYLSKYDEISLDSEDGRVQLDYIKRQSLDRAEESAYARRLARDLNITVSDKDVESFIDKERDTINGKVSQDTYDASISMIYGVSPSDYKDFTKDALLINKVSFAVDKVAQGAVRAVSDALDTNSDASFDTIISDVSSSKGYKDLTSGQSGEINVVDKFGGLRVSDISNLNIGKVAGPFKSVTSDGYYFVKVVSKGDSKIDFLYLKIPLNQFRENFKTLQTNHKIKEYIKVSEN